MYAAFLQFALRHYRICNVLMLARNF